MAAAAGHVSQAIVLAFGAGALGGPDALRLLRQFAGRSPAVDVAISVVVISLLTAPILGTMLLARFARKARAGGGGAPATELFAQVTAAVSVGGAFLVTACLLVVPSGGLGAAVRVPIEFDVTNPVVVTVLVVCVTFAAAAAGFLPCAVPLRRFLRGAGSAGGPAPAAPATKIKVAVFLAAMSSLVASFVACGGFDFSEFHWLAEHGHRARQGCNCNRNGRRNHASCLVLAQGAQYRRRRWWRRCCPDKLMPAPSPSPSPSSPCRYRACAARTRIGHACLA